jgi:hypothetical protein
MNISGTKRAISLNCSQKLELNEYVRNQASN